jgi:hypothetical protein
VRWTYLNKSGSNLGSDRRWLVKRASGFAACKARHASSCAGQKIRKWSTVSSQRPQQGQVGEGDSVRRCRCRARGAWRERSWKRRDACFRGNDLVSLRNFADGIDSSISLMRAYRGECLNCFVQLCSVDGAAESFVTTRNWLQIN